MGLSDRLAHAWNAFVNLDSKDRSSTFGDFGSAYSARPDRTKMTFGNERTIVSAIYTRIGLDIASIDFRHVRTDKANRYLEDVQSYLNECLSVEANLDQASQAFMLDVVLTLLTRGYARSFLSKRPSTRGCREDGTSRVCESGMSFSGTRLT